ncbi:unnamed protein product [Staurois parvus]|uniref:Uncharacterized protein n=1 Tax=Staurois parvus TaxID=386267 RepID=A0ABN9HQI6_9NEOB|nr:unnamed protein product [Staurois parvus]
MALLGSTDGWHCWALMGGTAGHWLVALLGTTAEHFWGCTDNQGTARGKCWQ